METETPCRRSRVVTFTAIRLRGPGFKQGQKFEKENFCFRRTTAVVKACHPCRVRPIKTPLYKTRTPIIYLKAYTCGLCLQRGLVYRPVVFYNGWNGNSMSCDSTRGMRGHGTPLPLPAKPMTSKCHQIINSCSCRFTVLKEVAMNWSICSIPIGKHCALHYPFPHMTVSYQLLLPARSWPLGRY